MARRIRIGAVSYLNTRPLVFGLEQGLGRQRIELSYDVPAILAARMAGGELDVGLLPTVELARIPGLEVVPGLSIASRGPAGSVLLITRRPLPRVTRVALDPESCTSNALVQVLFDQAWGHAPEFVEGSDELTESLARCDAAVRIGDKALFEPVPAGTDVVDLGRAWDEAIGLPFVYAVWAARPGVVDRELYRLLHRSRRLGAQAVEAIAENYTWRGRREPARARHYLTRNIRFRLGSAELSGLRRFLAGGARLGLVPEIGEIRFSLTRRSGCHERAVAAGTREVRSTR